MLFNVIVSSLHLDFLLYSTPVVGAATRPQVWTPAQTISRKASPFSPGTLVFSISLETCTWWVWVRACPLMDRWPVHAVLPPPTQWLRGQTPDPDRWAAETTAQGAQLNHQQHVIDSRHKFFSRLNGRILSAGAMLQHAHVWLPWRNRKQGCDRQAYSGKWECNDHPKWSDWYKYKHLSLLTTLINMVLFGVPSHSFSFLACVSCLMNLLYELVTVAEPILRAGDCNKSKVTEVRHEHQPCDQFWKSTGGWGARWNPPSGGYWVWLMPVCVFQRVLTTHIHTHTRMHASASPL